MALHVRRRHDLFLHDGEVLFRRMDDISLWILISQWFLIWKFISQALFTWL